MNMHAKERQLELHIVTSSADRQNAFGNLVGHENVKRFAPRFTEETIHKPVNSNPSEWPFEVAKEKALQDIAGLMVLAVVNNLSIDQVFGELKRDEKRTIRLYSDTVQVSFNADSPDDEPIVLEKPMNIKRWLIDREKGALAQSEKNFEICTALTGIDMTNPAAHPATILVRIAGKMRPYSLSDVVEIIEEHGDNEMMIAAGGISFQNGGTKLYDKKEPLRAYIQYDPVSQPQLLFELPTWENLDKETLQRFVYGAIPEALDALVTQIDNSRFVSEFSKKKGLIFPYPTVNNAAWFK